MCYYIVYELKPLMPATLQTMAALKQQRDEGVAKLESTKQRLQEQLSIVADKSLQAAKLEGQVLLLITGAALTCTACVGIVQYRFLKEVTTDAFIYMRL